MPFLTPVIQRITPVLLLFALVIQSCNKNQDFTPPLLDLGTPPPKPVSNGLTAKQNLGKLIYFDPYLSSSNGKNGGAYTQSCASCHLPQQGYAGMTSTSNRIGITHGSIPFSFLDGIGEGAANGAFGGRKPPSASYATFSPVIQMGVGEMTGELLGGLFWDGRATGFELSPAAMQARGPFLADKEHNFLDDNAGDGRGKVYFLKALYESMTGPGGYIGQWRTVWGNAFDTKFGPGAPSVSNISPADTAVIRIYNNVALSIADYEASSEVNQFSSKYDAVIKKLEKFTPLEQQGYNLMSNKAVGCGGTGCHAEKNANGVALWTDFGYDNLGLPWKHAYLGRGTAPNAPDAGFFTTVNDPAFPVNLKAANPFDYFGMFKTPSLRNVARGDSITFYNPYTQKNERRLNKSFMHNGIFSSLEEVVHFYNTRDIPGEGWNPVANNSTTRDANFRQWGPSEYDATKKTGGEVGRIGMTAAEETAIVAFLKTLSDRNNVAPPKYTAIQ
jgi:cytochrome c peroxidase